MGVSDASDFSRAFVLVRYQSGTSVSTRRGARCLLSLDDEAPPRPTGRRGREGLGLVAKDDRWRIPDELWAEMERLLRRTLASLAVARLEAAPERPQALWLDKGYRLQ